MWKKLSLRARLFLPLVVLFLTALLIGASALQVFSPAQFVYENEPESQAVRIVAKALNDALQSSANPQETLDAFAVSLVKTAVIQYRPLGNGDGPPPVRIASKIVPNWFISALSIPELGAAYPILIQDRHVGDVLFSPEISADVFEKWIGFLAITLSAAVLMVLTAGIASFIVGAVLHPLLDLGTGLTRMRDGRYDVAIPVTGAPEIRRSCKEANELASTLNRLSEDNQKLLHKLVSLQDRERQDLARELHDELGPMLFAIRANSTVLLESISEDDPELGPPVQGMLKAVEALQLANRRILEGLHPLYLHELGLDRSVQTLIEDARSQAPNIHINSNIDPRLNNVDSVLSQTIYRLLQEGVTNALRHAQAQSINVAAGSHDREIVVEVSDDGIGLAPDTEFGRGLVGMRERIRALGGTFELLRENARTIIRCHLPIRGQRAP
jgi:two-component system, NarL family, sensor histidine kinase UhpB